MAPRAALSRGNKAKLVRVTADKTLKCVPGSAMASKPADRRPASSSPAGAPAVPLRGHAPTLRPTAFPMPMPTSTRLPRPQASDPGAAAGARRPPSSACAAVWPAARAFRSLPRHTPCALRKHRDRGTDELLLEASRAVRGRTREWLPRLHIYIANIVTLGARPLTTRAPCARRVLPRLPAPRGTHALEECSTREAWPRPSRGRGRAARPRQSH